MFQSLWLPKKELTCRARNSDDHQRTEYPHSILSQCPPRCRRRLLGLRGHFDCVDVKTGRDESSRLHLQSIEALRRTFLSDPDELNVQHLDSPLVSGGRRTAALAGRRPKGASLGVSRCHNFGPDFTQRLDGMVDSNVASIAFLCRFSGLRQEGKITEQNIGLLPCVELLEG